MSNTFHHRKPGTPPRPRKRPLPRGRFDGSLARAIQSGRDLDLPAFESVKTRRTR